MNTVTEPNPLLDFSGLPRFRAIRPEHVTAAVDRVIAENREARERLLAQPAFNWDNFAQPLEDMNERLNRLWSPVSHLNSVMNNEALRQAYNENLPKLSEYYTELTHDERLYAAYKQIAANSGFAAFSAAQKKIVENTLRDFRLGGAELPPVKKARFKEIQKELSALSSTFSENVLDATQAWDLRIVDERDLAGLPDDARALARQSAEGQGIPGWRFTLEQPSFLAVMTHADDRNMRRLMYEAYVTRASDRGPNAGKWDNAALILKILRLRREAAALLGFRNYAEYALQTRMAKKVPEVLAFLHDLAARAKVAARRDFEELTTYTAEKHGVGRLEAWDIAYYGEKLQHAKYHFAQEDVRPYFPATRVVTGMFRVVERLYGIRIDEKPDVETWHPDVRFFEIHDDVGELRGRFYLDLYARANKRGGAWMDDCIHRKRTASGVQVPVAYLTCNFSPPVEGKPALFTHDEVQTLFHEFGHGLHHMLTRIDHVGVSGINGVAWDAVELPSQFMENWCWEREALNLISGHFETGEPIPPALYERMYAAKNFQSGMQCVRQLEFALFDMQLHTEFDPDGSQTVQELLDSVRREVAVVFPPDFNRFQNGFSHVFAGGYAAGYYSYKWAEVLSADAFGKFEERGIFDATTGREFLENILEQGGAYDPMELFVRFRGRKPTIDALLRHSGLAA
jgi:oligopeptidase A